MKTNSASLISVFAVPLGLFLGSGRVGAMDALDFWRSRPAPSQSCSSITYGNGRFVTVGLGGTILTSTTGAAWTSQVSGTTLSLQAVTYGNGLFVAVGGEPVTNIVLTSPDGIEWTPRSSNPAYPLNGVAYGNGRFVAVGDAGLLMTSADGVSWTAGAGLHSTRRMIAWGNGTFVAVGQSTGFGSNPMEISTNGVAWTQAGPDLSEEFFGIVFAGGFVAVGSAGAIATSPDGVQWTRRQSGTPNTLFGLSHGNGRFVAVGNFGTILTSADGITWTRRVASTAGGYLLTGAGYANGTFVVVGGPIWQSADTTLGEHYSGVTGNCLSVDLGPFSGALPPYGTVINYVTTYDGSTGMPREDVLTNGQFRTSGELRPRTNQAGVYEADYLTRRTSGSLLQYGSFSLTFPVTDSDTNGVPDVLQPDQPGNAVITGIAQTDWPVTGSATITGSATRNSGSTSGSYSMSVSSPLGTTTYDGSLYLLELAGYAAFSRGSTNVIHFDLTRNKPDGADSQLTGSTAFVVLDTNRLSLPQFTLRGADGSPYAVLPTTLERRGKKYHGDLQFIDGEPLTSWADYVRWILDIADNDDSDGNGIPDLTDVWSPPLRAFVSGSNFIIAWPAAASGFALEACGSLPTPAWAPVTTQPSVVGIEWQVTQVIAGSPRFYRLRLP